MWKFMCVFFWCICTTKNKALNHQPPSLRKTLRVWLVGPECWGMRLRWTNLIDCHSKFAYPNFQWMGPSMKIVWRLCEVHLNKRQSEIHDAWTAYLDLIDLSFPPTYQQNPSSAACDMTQWQVCDAMHLFRVFSINVLTFFGWDVGFKGPLSNDERPESLICIEQVSVHGVHQKTSFPCTTSIDKQCTTITSNNNTNSNSNNNENVYKTSCLNHVSFLKEQVKNPHIFAFLALLVGKKRHPFQSGSSSFPPARHLSLEPQYGQHLFCRNSNSHVSCNHEAQKVEKIIWIAERIKISVGKWKSTEFPMGKYIEYP